MPIFQIDIEKRQAVEYWTNVYHVQAPDLAASVAAAQDLVTMERAFHADYVAFTRVRTRTAIEGDEIYQTIPLNVVGARAGAGQQFLPLFNVARVDLQVAGGRPSRKYYRCPILEPDNENGNLAAGFITIIDNAITARIQALISAGTPLVDRGGLLILDGTVASAVGMRQLRRGSKRRAQPVLPPT